MGYTVSAQISDKAKLKQMLDFMRRHHKTLQDLCPKSYPYPDSPPPAQIAARNLSYDHARNHLGYGDSAKRHYVWCLCKWMAIQAGDRKEFDIGQNKKRILPFICYDEDEHLPILLKSVWGRRIPKGWNTTEDNGWHTGRAIKWEMHLCFPKGYAKAVQAQLTYLTEQWIKETGGWNDEESLFNEAYGHDKPLT